MTLVGKMGPVRDGFLVELFDHRDDSVSGYVLKMEKERIRLTQNNPLNKVNITAYDNWFEGPKWYNLERFEYYIVRRVP